MLAKTWQKCTTQCLDHEDFVHIISIAHRLHYCKGDPLSPNKAQLVTSSLLQAPTHSMAPCGKEAKQYCIVVCLALVHSFQVRGQGRILFMVTPFSFWWSKDHFKFTRWTGECGWKVCSGCSIRQIHKVLSQAKAMYSAMHVLVCGPHALLGLCGCPAVTSTLPAHTQVHQGCCRLPGSTDAYLARKTLALSAWTPTHPPMVTVVLPIAVLNCAPPPPSISVVSGVTKQKTMIGGCFSLSHCKDI